MNPGTAWSNNRVLVIDDNPAIHEDFRKILGSGSLYSSALDEVETTMFGDSRPAGAHVCFEIASASQGAEGLEMMHQALTADLPYAIAFVDMRMPPGWDGLATVTRLWKADPELQVVICTAYSDYSWEEMHRALGHSDNFVILKKPFDVVEVLQLAHALTKKWSLNQQAKGRLSELDNLVREKTQQLQSANHVLQAEIVEGNRAAAQIHKQAALLDLAQDAICVTDMERRIRYWNKGAEHLYGWAAAEAAGNKADELLFRDDLSSVKKAIETLVRKGEWKGEMSHATKAGRAVVVSGRWTLVLDREGKPESILMLNTDLTEKKTFEAHSLRAQRLESIGTLASGISHDLNNIFAPIMMAVPMLRWGLPPEEREKIISTVEASAKRGAELVKQLLSFGRGVEGKRVLIQAKHLVNEMVQIAQQTFPKIISVKSEVPEGIWPVLVDSTQLHQVLLNLCVNARDAMPEGGALLVKLENIRLDEDYVNMHPEATPGPWVRLRVSDTGTGIPSEIIDKIFEPFFTTKGPGKGTGLGLSTVLSIVKSHGGFVDIRSQAGKGTTFEVYLPATPAERIQAVEPVLAATLRGHSECILVVDDEPLIREITQKTLERYGYRVFLAADGAEALAVYAKHRIEIQAVMIDMTMPWLDGLSTIRALKKMNPAVKVIASSGDGSTDWRSEKLAQLNELGVTTFLAKPFHADKLLVSLQEIICPVGAVLSADT
ncbi:MAG: response regulator [Verrucomicrobiota bacterium]